MAKKVVVTLVDDTDNTKTADETVVFGIDGVEYSIDLSEKNAAKLRGAIEPWIGSATKIGGRRKTSGPKGVASKYSSEQLGEIRAWAPKNGFEVSPRGRVPANVVAAYEKAHA